METAGNATQPGMETAALIADKMASDAHPFGVGAPTVHKRTGLSTSAIYGYRDGVNVPRPRDAKCLAEALGIDPAALAGAIDRDRAARRKLAHGGAA